MKLWNSIWDWKRFLNVCSMIINLWGNVCSSLIETGARIKVHC